MGYAISWLAVKGKPAQEIREALGFRPTGEREEIPESEFSAVEMPNGWYLIVRNNYSAPVASDEAIRKLSASGCESVTCSVEEHVMVSTATGWENGRMKWSIVHDCDKGKRHLDVQGDLPPGFAAIRDTLLSKSKPDVDYIFDIPVETAKSVTGYRYDGDVPGLSGDVFQVLEPVPSQKPSLFKRLFGG